MYMCICEYVYLCVYVIVLYVGLKKKAQDKFNPIKSQHPHPHPSLNITKHSAHQAVHFALCQRPLKVSRLGFRVRQSRELERV